MQSTSIDIDYPYFPFRIAVDFVLVHKNEQQTRGFDENYRRLFEKAIQKEGLIVNHQVIGNLCFTLVSTPFYRLCREAEASQVCMPLNEEFGQSLNHYNDVILKFIFHRSKKPQLCVPFQRKNGQLFQNYTNEKIFFTPSQRANLTYQILSKINISRDIFETNEEQRIEEAPMIVKLSSKKRYGLNWLIMKQIYNDAFVLHTPSAEEPSSQSNEQTAQQVEYDPRKVMTDFWKRWNHKQPLQQIREYFGEQIAFYFAWQSTFVTLLLPPTIFGLIVFIYGFIQSIHRTPFNNECGNILECFSSIAHLLTFWFIGSFDTPMSAVFAIFMSIWGSVFLQLWRRINSILAFEWSVDDFQSIEPDRAEYRGSLQARDPVTGDDVLITPAIIRYLKMFASFFIVLLSMLVVVCSVLTVTLIKLWTIKWCDAHIAASSLRWLLTILLPAVLNTVSIMSLDAIYYRIAVRLNNWENHRTQSEHRDALAIKIASFQFVNTHVSLVYLALIHPRKYGFQENGLFGLGNDFQDTCDDGSCASILGLQLLSHTLIKPIPKFVNDVVLPYIFKLFRLHRWSSRTDIQKDENSINSSDEANVLVREWMKPSAGDFVLWEMNEKIIMFGTTMMFASLFPLAPLISLIICLLDNNIDGMRLMWLNRKPIPAVSSGIGIWLHILTFFQYLAVFTNAFIVSFTSDFCNKFFNVTNCSIKDRLIIVIVFQNVVFLLKYALSAVIPSVPASVKVATRKKRYIMSYITEKGDVPQRINNKKKTRIAKLAWITSRRRPQSSMSNSSQVSTIHKQKEELFKVS